MIKTRRSLFCAVILWVVACFGAPAAWAQSAPGPLVPDDTPLDRLPSGTVLVVQTDIVLDDKFGDLLRESKSFPEIGGFRTHLIGNRLTISKATEVRYRDWSMGLYGQLSFDAITLIFDLDKFRPATAGNFHKHYGHLVRLHVVDPYAGMDAAVVVDLLTAKITKAIADGKEQAALPEFERLEKLSPSLPEAAHYYYVKALFSAKRAPEGRQRANDYLKKFGPKGKYYRQTIELLSAQ